MARKKRTQDKPPELNLVPIMAIMVILVPMLIYMFTFHQIKVQRVTAPRRSNGPRSGEIRKKPLNLTVTIVKDKGYRLTWDEVLQPEQQRMPLIPMVQTNTRYCGTEDRGYNDRAPGCFQRAQGCFCYDYATLYNELVAKKDQFSTPKHVERRVNLTADAAVTWEVVSRTMDVVKCKKDQDTYANNDEWLASNPKRQARPVEIPGMDDPQFLCEELFPEVVFAMTE